MMRKNEDGQTTTYLTHVKHLQNDPQIVKTMIGKLHLPGTYILIVNEAQ